MFIDWCYWLREFMVSEYFRFFKNDILEVLIYDLVDENGVWVNLFWFGLLRKKDFVVVVIFFGILGWVLCWKNVDEDIFLNFSEFSLIREGLNFFMFGNMVWSGNFFVIFLEMFLFIFEENGSDCLNVVFIGFGK